MLAIMILITVWNLGCGLMVLAVTVVLRVPLRWPAPAARVTGNEIKRERHPAALTASADPTRARRRT